MKKLYIIMTIFLALLPTICADLNNGIQTVWKFDDDLTDAVYGVDELNNLSGTYTSFSTNSVEGKSIFFDETDKFVDSIKASNLYNSSEKTINAWVLPQALGTKHYFSTGQTHVTGGRFEGRINVGGTFSLDTWTTLASTTGTYDTGNYYMVTLTYNSSHVCVTVNASEKSCLAAAIATENYIYRIGSRVEYTNQDWNGYIDEVYIWNRSLNGTEISDLYNDGVGKFYPFIDNPLTVSFNSSVPADIDSANVFPLGAAKINFSVDHENELNLSRTRFFYKTNNSINDITFFVNGTAVEGFQERTIVSNNSDIFEFLAPDQFMYPATYNYNETYMENTQHSWLELQGISSYVTTQLQNFSVNKTYNQLEFFVKSNALTALSLRTYYCNSSFALTNSPTGSGDCAEIAEILPSQAYNHTHSQYSSHYLVGLPIVGGKIAGITATTTSYISFRGRSGQIWNISFIPEHSRYRAMVNGTPATSTDFSGTTDLHIHQYGTTDTFIYFAEFCDVAGNCKNSSIVTESIEFQPLPPTPPFVYVPNTSYYNEISGNPINISWNPSVGIGGHITNYNVSLYDETQAFVAWINITGNVTFYEWDTLSVDEGNYTVGITAIDNNSRKTIGYSEEFGIDRTEPFLIIFSPLNNSNVSNGSVSFSATFTDSNNMNTVNISCFGANNYSFFLSNIGTAVYQLSETTSMPFLGGETCVFNWADSHTKKEIKEKFVEKSKNDGSLSFDGKKLVDAITPLIDINVKQKDIDRYGFCINVSPIYENIEFSIPDGCVPAKNSGFKGHLICGNQWVDFENVPDLPVLIVGDRVIVQNTKRVRDICFDSVGDLNTGTATITFSVIESQEAGTGSIMKYLVCPNRTVQESLIFIACIALIVFICCVGYFMESFVYKVVGCLGLIIISLLLWGCFPPLSFITLAVSAIVATSAFNTKI